MPNAAPDMRPPSSFVTRWGWAISILVLTACYTELQLVENRNLDMNAFFLFTCLFLALSLCCCEQTFSSRSEQGLLFIVVRGLLTPVTSLVMEHRLWARQALECRFSSCGIQAYLLQGM